MAYWVSKARPCSGGRALNFCKWSVQVSFTLERLEDDLGPSLLGPEVSLWDSVAIRGLPPAVH